MKTKLVSAIALLAIGASSAQGVSYEYRRLYKDAKIMGAGGANVASGGSFGALFSNPAGLAKIPQEYGWEFQVANIGVAVNDNIRDLSDIIDDAEESESKAADTLKEHIGDRYNIDLNVIEFSIAKKFDQAAFGLGAVTSANVNFAVHQGFGASGVLESEILAVVGAAGGFAYDFNDLTIGSYALNTLSVGVGAKALRYGYLNRTFSAADLANEEFENIDDEIEEGNAFVGDIGVIYDVFPNFAIGLSALNIGGIGEGALEIPATVNVGASYVYRVADRSFFNQVRVGADYIDLAGAYEDSSYVKRTSFGADLNVWDGWFSTFAVQAGLYQGKWTAGANLRLSLVDLSFATYAEELGAYAGQDGDRRYMASFGFNW
ncbi:MAG: conjugal transfer protein TraF [Helicobacteraceae bacterium]|jgi:hypothetical protein|nr:conjugal transfer protein TraF [Helicobacteraceae bacterium]